MRRCESQTVKGQVQEIWIDKCNLYIRGGLLIVSTIGAILMLLHARLGNLSQMSSMCLLSVIHVHYYLCRILSVGNVLTGVCLFVCLSVSLLADN